MPESLANLSQGLDAEPLRSSCRVGTRSGEAAGAVELVKRRSSPSWSSAIDFQPGEPGRRLLVSGRADAAGDSPAPLSHPGPGTSCAGGCSGT